MTTRRIHGIAQVVTLELKKFLPAGFLAPKGDRINGVMSPVGDEYQTTTFRQCIGFVKVVVLVGGRKDKFRRLVAVDLHLEKALIPCVENQLSVGAPQPTTVVGCFIAIDIAENRALLGFQ